MIDAYEIKEYVEKQEHIQENLERFINTILFKYKEKDKKFDLSINNIINTLKATSEYTGGDEGWVTWNMRKVQEDIEYVCSVLKVNAKYFEGYFKDFEEKKNEDSTSNMKIKETNEIVDDITEKMEELEFFKYAFKDGETSEPKEYEDDGAIFICRGKYRFTFYNGQDEGELGDDDIPKLAKQVDEVLKNIKPKCKFCGEEFDKKEVQRIYGIGSMVDLGGFCSPGCYTANLVNVGNETFKNSKEKKDKNTEK